MPNENGHTQKRKTSKLPPPPRAHVPSVVPGVKEFDESIEEAKQLLRDMREEIRMAKLPVEERRQAEGWRITGHLPTKLLPALNRAVKEGNYRSRSAWVIDTLTKALTKK